MENMFELLTNLSIDPFAQEAFRRDPEAFMKDSGLTTGEMARFLDLAGSQSEGIAKGTFARCAAAVDPGPDPVPDPDPVPGDIHR